MLNIDINLEIDKMQNYLKHSQNILLVNHRRMDGDAFWSLSWFYYLLKKKGYNVIALNDDPKPSIFEFLDNKNIFSQIIDENIFSPDLIITFDIASIEQYGNIYEQHKSIFQNTTIISIDHHLSNTGLGNINIINTNASSTCEIVWDIIKKIWWEKDIDSKISTFLLTGIITDTNSFFNSNSSSKSFLSASEIMKYKPNHQDIIINLFKKKPYNRIKLWGKILESLKDIKNGKIVWNCIPKSLFIQTGTTDKDISWLIDEFLTTIDTLEIAFLLYEIDDKKIKWSFRSKTDNINLSDFCLKWWGWWHARASGFVVEWKNLYEVEAEVVEELKKIM